MKIWRAEPHWLIRMDKGDEIISSLERFAKAEEIKTGSITGIGGVGPVTLAFYEIKKRDYATKIFKVEYELLSLQGNFSVLDQKPHVHLHAILGDSKFRAFGGHVVKMTVALTAEIIVVPDAYQMDRAVDQKLGLKLWHGCKPCEI